MTLYLKLGGRPAIVEAMRRLETLMIQEQNLPHVDSEASLEQSEELCEFLIFLSGGAPFYDNAPIGEILGPICPCDGSYDLFVDLLVTAMFGPRCAPRTEAELRLLMEHIRPHVVGREPGRPSSQSDGHAGAAA